VHLIALRHASSRAEREGALLAANESIASIVEQLAPFDLLYERYSLWSHRALETARTRGITTVIEVNAPLIEEQRRHRELVDARAAEGSASRAFAAAEVVAAVSREVADYLRSKRWAVGRIHVIPNGVNVERFTRLVEPAVRWPGAFVLGFAGSLKPWHGLGVLVEAFARLRAHSPRARLLIVGDGPERANLEASLARVGATEETLLTGAVPVDEVPSWIASMDVVAAPYPNEPGFYFSPLKLYEYMAIVASAIGQVEEVLRDGVDGLLCRPGDAAELADALARLEADHELRDRLGRNARVAALRDHSWRQRVRMMFELAGAVAPAVISTRI
jgi:glycosyltransferase involved in cell wall biosynthesis